MSSTGYKTLKGWKETLSIQPRKEFKMNTLRLALKKDDLSFLMSVTYSDSEGAKAVLAC